MIMFYDILLLDDVVCALEAHDNRRRLLETLIRHIPGRAGIGSREVIDFSSTDAEGPRAVTQRWEGLVLKRCDSPYISFGNQRPFIKLKKDYIPGHGDTADFAIIGGRRDARDENELGLGKLWWTSFYIACIENEDEVRHLGAKENIKYLNRRGYLVQTPFADSILEFDVLVETIGHTLDGLDCSGIHLRLRLKLSQFFTALISSLRPGGFRPYA